MKDVEQKFECLKRLFPNAQLAFERNEPFAFLPSFKFATGGRDHVTDVLLCPRQHASAGYPTRLFLEKQPPKGGQNWNVFQVLGRTWRACSWKDVPATLTWPEILFAHLGAFK